MGKCYDVKNWQEVAIEQSIGMTVSGIRRKPVANYAS
jgi:hypothetical protein